MRNDNKRKTRAATFRSWVGIAGLWGAGLLPCPGCGAPMLFHIWPLALLFTLAHMRRNRKSKAALIFPDESHLLKPEEDKDDPNQVS